MDPDGSTEIPALINPEDTGYVQQTELTGRAKYVKSITPKQDTGYVKGARTPMHQSKPFRPRTMGPSLLIMEEGAGEDSPMSQTTSQLTTSSSAITRDSNRERYGDQKLERADEARRAFGEFQAALLETKALATAAQESALRTAAETEALRLEMTHLATSTEKQEAATVALRADMNAMVEGLHKAQNKQAGDQRLFMMKTRIEEEYHKMDLDIVHSCLQFQKRIQKGNRYYLEKLSFSFPII